MIPDLEIRPLAQEDKPYALSSWRESHKQAPGASRMPWSFYKQKYGLIFRELLDRDLTLGAYIGDVLLGFLVASPGKRITTLHWVQVKFEVSGQAVRRRGVMTALLEAANLGDKFVYTLKGQKRKGGSFDETLVTTLAERGQTAVYTPLIDWIKP